MANSIKGMDGGSIGPDNSNPIEQIRLSTPVNSGGSGTGASNPSSSDSVHITEGAKTLASLEQSVSDTPDVDMNRVSAVQQAISSGTYQINPQDIADRMLQLEQDLGSARHQ